jgi:hypothetical protein
MRSIMRCKIYSTRIFFQFSSVDTTGKPQIAVRQNVCHALFIGRTEDVVLPCVFRATHVKQKCTVSIYFAVHF